MVSQHEEQNKNLGNDAEIQATKSQSWNFVKQKKMFCCC